MANPALLFTSYSGVPVGGDPGRLLQAGNLREQIRSDKAQEQYARDTLAFRQQQAAQEQANKVQQLRWETKQGIYNAASSGNEAALSLWLGRARDLGLGVEMGAPVQQVPAPQAPGQAAAPPPQQSAVTQPKPMVVPPVTPAEVDQKERELATGQGEVEEPEGSPPVDPDEDMFNAVRAAEQRGRETERAKRQNKKRAEQLRSRAAAEKDAGKRAAYLERAQELDPSPTVGLQFAHELEQAGDLERAANEYVKIATADPTGNEMDDQAIQVARQKVSALAQQKFQPLAPGPAAVGAGPQAQASPSNGFTLVDPTTGTVERISPRDMHAMRHSKVDKMWDAAASNAYHPVMKDLAEDARALSHELVSAGLTPAEAFAATNKQYNERSRVWAGVQAAQAAAYSRAQTGGDKMFKDRWTIQRQYENQITDNLSVGKFQRELQQLDTIRNLATEGGPKARGAAWGLLVKYVEGGRATDPDYNRVAHAGGLVQQMEELVARAAGNPTDAQIAEATNIVNQLDAAIKRYLIANVKKKIDMFRQSRDIRELFGDETDNAAKDMSASILGPLAPSFKGRGIAHPAPSAQPQGGTSSRTSGSVRQSGPLGSAAPSAADQLNQVLEED